MANCRHYWTYSRDGKTKSCYKCGSVWVAYGSEWTGPP